MPYDSSDPTAKESALQPSEQRRLEEANYFLENNKPAQAAPIFAKLAEVLKSAKQPKRAANLHLKAALAFARSRNEAALMQARAALSLLLQYKLDQQASVFYNELMHELNKRGMKSTRDMLASEFSAKILQSTPPISHTAQRKNLPRNCPSCGAPLGRDNVTWVDTDTAECGFCNTPIHTSA